MRVMHTMTTKTSKRCCCWSLAHVSRSFVNMPFFFSVMRAKISSTIYFSLFIAVDRCCLCIASYDLMLLLGAFANCHCGWIQSGPSHTLKKQWQSMFLRAPILMMSQTSQREACHSKHPKLQIPFALGPWPWALSHSFHCHCFQKEENLENA